MNSLTVLTSSNTLTFLVVNNFVFYSLNNGTPILFNVIKLSKDCRKTIAKIHSLKFSQ